MTDETDSLYAHILRHTKENVDDLLIVFGGITELKYATAFLYGLDEGDFRSLAVARGVEMWWAGEGSKSIIVREMCLHLTLQSDDERGTDEL